MLIAALLLGAAQEAAGKAAPAPPELVYESSLAPVAKGEPGTSARMWYSAPAEWSLIPSVPDDGLGAPVPDSGPALWFKSAQSYQPPHRSPHSLGLVAGLELGSTFFFEVEAMQTGIETPHRDLVLVVGFQSAAQFFYVHLGMLPDAHSSNVFHVDGKARARVGEIAEEGIPWSRGAWHRLRVECDAERRMRVFFDDMETPAFDKKLPRDPSGMIGFGSFDDAGAFRNLRVWAPPASQDSPARSRRPFQSSPFGSVSLTAGPAGDDAQETVSIDGNAVRCTSRPIRVGRGGYVVHIADLDGDGRYGSRGDYWDALQTDDPKGSSYRPLAEGIELEDGLTLLAQPSTSGPFPTFSSVVTRD